MVEGAGRAVCVADEAAGLGAEAVAVADEAAGAGAGAGVGAGAGAGDTEPVTAGGAEVGSDGVEAGVVLAGFLPYNVELGSQFLLRWASASS